VVKDKREREREIVCVYTLNVNTIPIYLLIYCGSIVFVEFVLFICMMIDEYRFVAVWLYV
jgi:hypothetical protein